MFNNRILIVFKSGFHHIVSAKDNTDVKRMFTDIFNSDNSNKVVELLDETGSPKLVFMAREVVFARRMTDRETNNQNQNNQKGQNERPKNFQRTPPQDLTVHTPPPKKGDIKWQI